MFNSSLATNVVKTALDLVFDGEYGYQEQPGLATAEHSGVFMQESVDRAAVITEQYMGPGYFDTRAETQDVQSATSRVGNQKTFSVLNYAKSTDVSKNLMDDDQHSVIEKMIKKFARNARLTRDKNAFNQYNLGFTTVTTNDGVALFSSSHVTLSGDTVDNLEGGALADGSLNTAFTSLQLQKTQDGTLGGHTAAILLVPTTLFKTAQEVTKSALISGSANNNLNYYSTIFPGLEVAASPFLDAAYGGTATQYFVLSRDHSMNRWVRQSIATDLVDYKFQRNNNYIYKAEYREVIGPISFEGILGSTGA